MGEVGGLGGLLHLLWRRHQVGRGGEGKNNNYICTVFCRSRSRVVATRARGGGQECQVGLMLVIGI